MEFNVESGIDMNSSSDLREGFSSPECITTTTKLTPRALVYDDIDGDTDDMSGMIRRRTLGAFAKNNNNNNIEDGDKSSLDEDEDGSKFLISFHILHSLCYQ